MYWFNCSLNFSFEWFTFYVWANSNMRMSNPSIKGTLVKISCNLYTFVSSFIIFETVELFSSICCWAHEDNSIISSISQGDPTPSLFVHNRLELLLWHISCGISCSTIAEDNSWGLTHFCKSSKVIFSIHLKTNKQTLETNTLLDIELAHHDHSSSLNHESWNLWNWKYSESLGC